MQQMPTTAGVQVLFDGNFLHALQLAKYEALQLRSYSSLCQCYRLCVTPCAAVGPSRKR